MLLSAGTSLMWQWHSDVYTVHLHTNHTGETYTLVASSYNGTIVLYLSLLFHPYWLDLGSHVDLTFNHLVVYSLTRGLLRWCMYLVVCVIQS